MAGGLMDVGMLQGGVNSKSVAGSSNVTLTETERNCIHQLLSGTITANISVIVGDPATLAGMEWDVYNGTAGAFKLTFIGSSGSGVVIPPLARLRVKSDGTNIVAAGLPVGTIANANVCSGVPFLHRIDVPDSSTDTDVAVVDKIRVIDAWGLNTGIAAHASADTWQIKNGSSAISDAVAKTATVNAIRRVSTIDPAQHEIAAGGTLRVTTVKSTNSAATVYVLVVKVA